MAGADALLDGVDDRGQFLGFAVKGGISGGHVSCSNSR
jgi:hypothetical protein